MTKRKAGQPKSSPRFFRSYLEVRARGYEFGGDNGYVEDFPTTHTRIVRGKEVLEADGRTILVPYVAHFRYGRPELQPE